MIKTRGCFSQIQAGLVKTHLLFVGTAGLPRATLQRRVAGKEGCAVVGVDDVAAALLARTGSITTMKLQKLVFYSQAWHLAFTGGPLFPETI